MELLGVELVRPDLEDVAGGRSSQPLVETGRCQRASDPRHVSVDVVCRGIGWVFAGPDDLDEPVERHHFAGVERQRRDQAPLAWPTDGDRLADTYFDGAEDSYLHVSSLLGCDSNRTPPSQLARRPESH